MYICLDYFRLFEESLEALGCRDRPIRIVYALQTLCGLIKSVFKKVSGQGTAGDSFGGNSPASTPTQEGKILVSPSAWVN